MKKFFQTLDHLDGHMACIALAVTFILLTLQVFFRYVLDASLTWSEEVSRFFYVWFVYLGVSMAARSGEHVRVAVHLRLLFPRFHHKIILMADLVWLGYCLLLLWESIKFIRSMFQYPFRSPALGISMVWVYMIIPLVFLLMIIRLIQMYYREFTGRKEEKDPGSEATL